MTDNVLLQVTDSQVLVQSLSAKLQKASQDEFTLVDQVKQLQVDKSALEERVQIFLCEEVAAEELRAEVHKCHNNAKTLQGIIEEQQRALNQVFTSPSNKDESHWEWQYLFLIFLFVTILEQGIELSRSSEAQLDLNAIGLADMERGQTDLECKMSILRSTLEMVIVSEICVADSLFSADLCVCSLEKTLEGCSHEFSSVVSVVDELRKKEALPLRNIHEFLQQKHALKAAFQEVGEVSKYAALELARFASEFEQLQREVFLIIFLFVSGLF